MRAERMAQRRRYTWTDAFGVVLLVSLYAELGEPSFLDEAEWVVSEVDRVLGRPRGIRMGEAPDRDGQFSTISRCGSTRSPQTLKNVERAWVKEQKVILKNGTISEYGVDLKVISRGCDARAEFARIVIRREKTLLAQIKF